MLFANLIDPMLAQTDPSRAISIAVVGMGIVACALLLICLFISSLPRLLTGLAQVWPESDEPHAGQMRPDSLDTEEDAVIAAIGFVLQARLRASEQENTSPSQQT